MFLFLFLVFFCSFLLCLCFLQAPFPACFSYWISHWNCSSTDPWLSIYILRLLIGHLCDKEGASTSSWAPEESLLSMSVPIDLFSGGCWVFLERNVAWGEIAWMSCIVGTLMGKEAAYPVWCADFPLLCSFLKVAPFFPFFSQLCTSLSCVCIPSLWRSLPKQSVSAFFCLRDQTE